MIALRNKNNDCVNLMFFLIAQWNSKLVISILKNYMSQKGLTVFKYELLRVHVCVCSKCKAESLITLLRGVILLLSLVAVTHTHTCRHFSLQSH